MPIPAMVTAALISGGASIIGGAMANRSNRKQFDQNAALQREFAQQGIRWKVEDAKAAGLHPLYAIGSTGASYSPSTYSDAMGPAIAQAGQQIGTGIAAHSQEKTRKREASLQRQLQQNQIIIGQQRLRSQIHVDTAQANYYNAMAQQISRQPSSGFPADSESSPVISATTGQAEIVPQKIPSAAKDDPSQAAGPDRPAWMDVRIGNNAWLPEELQTLRVPWSDESWAEEFVEKLPVIAAANAARYYKWLSSDSIAAMYMTPYGRAKLLAMALKKAPATTKQILKSLRQKYARQRKDKDNQRGGFSGTGEF